MSTAALEALQAHYDAMPPVRAMRVRVQDWDGARLQLSAPLGANVNDKGCAFGGSLCGLMTLAGWGWATLGLEQAGHTAEVYVADSSVRYLAPLYADLVAEAGPAPDQDWAAILATFAQRGRARVEVEARVVLPGSGAEACTMRARFALLAPRAPAAG